LNLYAAYEVAVFRRWPRAVVILPAAVVPVLTSIVFLCLPTRVQKQGASDEEQSGDSTGPAPASAQHAEDHHHGHGHDHGAGEDHAGQEAHAHATHEEPQAHVPPPIPATQVFKRGEVSINRRYIETKFAGFFRMVPSEADKDLYLVMKTARGEFLGKRVSKITTTDITLQLALEGGGSEETFPLNDIFEIQIRHKDAPAQ
ncbi:MAG TPA: hypothetical protein VK968_02975, partial [Roseimicrobium sp.]|nr:hypothetical protein [Roseimicrobium sp.]